MALIEENINDIEASVDYEAPGAGVYIGKIVKAVHEPEKKYVALYIDIADGKFKGYAKSIEDRLHQDWGYIKSYLSYKKTALPFTVKNLNIIAESSKVDAAKLKADFNSTEGKSLEGKFVGFVVGQQEYRKSNGNVGLRFQLPELVPAKTVKEKPESFTIPALVKLQEDNTNESNTGSTSFSNPPSTEEVPW